MKNNALKSNNVMKFDIDKHFKSQYSTLANNALKKLPNPPS